MAIPGFRLVCAMTLLWGLLTGASDLVQAQDSPHGKLSFACEDCHIADSWKQMPVPAKFDHKKVGFVLKGQHNQVQCMDCHTALTFKFKKSSARCVDCHEDVHRGELGATCDRCHSPQSWLVPDMIQKHASTSFPLVGVHSTVPCQECHTSQEKHQFVGLRTDCFGCHQQDFATANGATPAHSGFGTDCQSCHALNATNWGVMGVSFAGNFDHAKTGFALAGAHAAIACAQCHPGNVFRAASTQCASCHNTDFTTATAPPHAGFSTDCTTCHTMTAWQPATFNHTTSTTFPLTGAHASAAVACQQCHVNNVFKGLSTTCYSCHQQQFTAAATPVKHTGFSTDCTSCHTTNPGWTPSTFNHSTQFTLVGAHAAATCASCHVNNQYVGLATTCYGCHTQDFTTANAPPHTGFSTDCTTCHGNTTWQPATFNHTTGTTFPLTGGHTNAAITCQQCHVNNVYKGLSTACYSCHQQDFTTALTPVKHTGFATDCSTCHTTNPAWTPSTFNHATQFALVGAHASATCAQCHVNNQYVGLATTCYGCHTQDFATANSPPHTGFSQDCTTCHGNTAWQPATFNHANTPFPLTGGHTNAAITCQQCHVNNVYAGLSTACYSCHQTDFTNALTPVKHTGFATDCSTCHTTNPGWTPSTFNHATQFALTGGHATATCIQCHVNNQYVGLATTCYGCHQTDFTNALTPVKHTGFATDCSTCHTTNPGWTPSTFNHSTQFALVGAHTTLACAQCHVNNQYVGLATTCYGCHTQDFTTANAPPHTGFSQDCTTCHTNTAWQPATFNHANTPFPLTGGHTNAAITCQQCHVNNVYAGLSTACYSCHQTDFTNALTPVKHTGFPTDCSGCHTTNPAWTPSTFNHATQFALTGAHAAIACAQCHVNNQYVGLATTCYGCHQTDFTTANAPPHTGFPQDCTTCHSNTAWQPATFDHTVNTTFPLTGAHLTGVTCQQCHVNNVYKGLSTACYSCHQTQFTAATTPVPHTGFPTDCSTCHTTNPAWTPSTYSHRNAVPRFEQDSRHLNAACNKCHQTPTNYTQYCCQSSGCHNTCAGSGG